MTFELDLEAERLHFARYIIVRFLLLRRSAQARPDVIGKMRDLPVSIVALQRLLLQLLQFGERLRRIQWWRGRWGRRRRTLLRDANGREK